MKRFVLALLIALLTPPALAESPIEVTADTFVVDQAKSEATFTGNVVITRSDLTVWADKVLVTFGKEGLQNIQHITATGNVRLKTDEQDATGDRATFDPNSQIMRLSGNVTVVNASGTLNGPELVVDLVNQTTTFSASGGGRVTGVFTPQ
jgi:lipopolysaccharide export system protein LptA